MRMVFQCVSGRDVHGGLARLDLRDGLSGRIGTVWRSVTASEYNQTSEGMWGTAASSTVFDSF